MTTLSAVYDEVRVHYESGIQSALDNLIEQNYNSRSLAKYIKQLCQALETRQFIDACEISHLSIEPVVLGQFFDELNEDAIRTMNFDDFVQFLRTLKKKRKGEQPLTLDHLLIELEQHSDTELQNIWNSIVAIQTLMEVQDKHSIMKELLDIIKHYPLRKDDVKYQNNLDATFNALQEMTSIVALNSKVRQEILHKVDVLRDKYRNGVIDNSTHKKRFNDFEFRQNADKIMRRGVKGIVNAFIDDESNANISNNLLSIFNLFQIMWKIDNQSYDEIKFIDDKKEFTIEWLGYGELESAWFLLAPLSNMFDILRDNWEGHHMGPTATLKTLEKKYEQICEERFKVINSSRAHAAAEEEELTCFDIVTQEEEKVKDFLDENAENFVIKLPNSNTYECSSVEYLKQSLSVVREDLDQPYYKVWYACKENNLSMGDDNIIKDTEYIKLGSMNFLVKKPYWLYDKNPPKPRIFELTEVGQVTTIAASDQLDGDGGHWDRVSADHCNSEPITVYELVHVKPNSFEPRAAEARGTRKRKRRAKEKYQPTQGVKTRKKKKKKQKLKKKK